MLKNGNRENHVPHLACECYSLSRLRCELQSFLHTDFGRQDVLRMCQQRRSFNHAQQDDHTAQKTQAHLTCALCLEILKKDWELRYSEPRVAISPDKPPEFHHAFQKCQGQHFRALPLTALPRYCITARYTCRKLVSL